VGTYLSFIFSVTFDFLSGNIFHYLFSYFAIHVLTDLSSIRVILFCGKSDEWPIWSEKFLAKTKRYGLKDVLIGKLSIPKADEEFDEDSITGKKMKNTIKVKF
jgi:hypothetical protein